MVLRNYWWLLIWIVAGGFFLSQVFEKERIYVNGRMEYRWQWVPAILLALPFVVWAGNRSYFGDTETYRSTFNSLPNTLSQIIPYISENAKDQGFSIFSILFKSLISDNSIIFFLVIAFLQMLFLVYIYRKYSTNYWMSMFFFIISTDYLSWMHNGMRQFLAVTMIFACFGFIVRKQYLPAILVILLASTIHGSAIMMLPVIFVVQGRALSFKTMFTVGLLMIMVIMMDKFLPAFNELLQDTQYNTTLTDEIWTNDDGTSILRVLFYSIPACLAILGRKIVIEENNPIINVSVNCSMLTVGIYLVASVSSGIYIGRLPIYTTLMGYISMPWLIDHIFTKQSSKLVWMAIIGVYLVFFYVQMHMTWGFI